MDSYLRQQLVCRAATYMVSQAPLNGPTVCLENSWSGQHRERSECMSCRPRQNNPRAPILARVPTEVSVGLVVRAAPDLGKQLTGHPRRPSAEPASGTGSQCRSTAKIRQHHWSRPGPLSHVTTADLIGGSAAPFPMMDASVRSGSQQTGAAQRESARPDPALFLKRGN